MKKRLNNALLFLLYMLGFVFALVVVRYGWTYYVTPLVDRPHHALHAVLKPGGLYGHGFGIIGSVMVLLLFLYSVRKRRMFGVGFGRMSTWLNIHIFFGIMGPILITLHTAMKFNGIVSVSYYSMLAVMFSGILGRYIYKQIPRTPAGETLTMEQINDQDKRMTHILVEEYHLPPDALRAIQRIAGVHIVREHHGLGILWTIIKNDFRRPFMLRRLHKALQKSDLHLPAQIMHIIMLIARQKSLLMRKRAFLNTILKVFHYWHVIHKPFAYVMIIIMFLHIGLAIAFGYLWIF